jgi:hypothetical protein
MIQIRRKRSYYYSLTVAPHLQQCLLLCLKNTNTTTTITKPFPCLSGDINDYCLGYHHGASAADKDRSNDNSTVSLNQYRCNDGNSQHCAGFAHGYVDETAELQ